MAISTVIPRGRPDHPSLDFELLRSEGIRHLENLATEAWTDFNAHDPGITLLELLSYAITDLGYRTRRLPIGDLLAGGAEEAFFEATDILTCAPVTARDYRKLLIDIPGVKNAWIASYSNPVVFTEGGLGYGIGYEEKFRFRHLGEYKDDSWVLNDERINGFLEEEYGEQIPAGAKGWIESWVKDGVGTETCECVGISPEDVYEMCFDQKDCPPFTERVIPTDADQEKCELLYKVMCKYGYTPLKVEEYDNPSGKWLRLNGLARIILDLDDDINPENTSETQPIVDRVMHQLHRNRFLCHDYIQPPLIVKRKRMSVCLHIEAKSDKDINEVAAEAIWQMEQLLTPTLRFYTFSEMLEKGYEVEDIYNGPLLNHGFLDDKEVDKAQLLKEFRHSDITNTVTTLEDVLNVHELKVKMHPEDEAFKLRTSYTIYDADEAPMKPFIDLCESCVYVTQNGRRCEVRESAVMEALKLKRLLAECHDAPGGLEPPKGRPRPGLSEYRSLQYDLPEVYGVGDYVVREDSPFYKKGARKQLQSYLAFFDQILAAYLSQLGEVRRLFAVEQDPSLPTYPTADLSGIPGMGAIVDTKKPFAVESDATRQDRRNRLLDHLLARFGEAFSEYVAALASSCKGSEEEGYEADFATLLRAKSEFLRELPHLGHDRAKAYSYRGIKSKRVWNTDNVAGIKKRVHRKVGLRGSWNEMSLLTKPPYLLEIRKVRGARGAIRYQVAFKALLENLPPGVDFPFQQALLFGPKHTTRKAAQNKRMRLNAHIWDAALYSVGEHPRESGQYTVFFKASDRLSMHGEAMSEREAETRLRHIQDLVSYEPANEKEGFHVLEHILLRPNDTDDLLLEIPLGCEPQYTPRDPYSNWLTVVLPNWPKKMKDRSFQEHLEQAFRQEMPAEAAVRFCWLDKEKMRAFEERYRVWLEALAACEPDDCQITPAANELIKWLNEHPCDCDCHSCCASYEACEDCKEC